MEERSLLHLKITFEVAAMLQIVEEHLLETTSHIAVVEEKIRLEIVFKRAEIDVRRAARTHAVVGDEQFRVVETAFVEHNCHT